MSSKARQRQKRKEKRKQIAIDRIYKLAVEELERKNNQAFILNYFNEYGNPDPVPQKAQQGAKMKGVWGSGITKINYKTKLS